MAKKIKPNYAVVSDEPGWLEAIDWREANASWLQISAEITSHILELLDEKQWSKAVLAKKLGVKPQQVTKILSGHANLQLSTIAKLQEALEVKLITTRFAYPWKNHVQPEFQSAGLMATEATGAETLLPAVPINVIANEGITVERYAHAGLWAAITDEMQALVQQAGNTQYAMAA